ncbi:hypothetical protein D3C78_97160 [compost metagenome]
MLYTWDEILDLEHKWDNLLLGNGFSCNIWKKYSYDSLLKYSKKNGVEPVLNEDVFQIFRNLATSNFEDVLKALTLTAIVKEAIGEEVDDILELYEDVRNNLFNTVHATHIPFDVLEKKLIGEELAKYRKVFTTCYDLIPYWSAFHTISSSKQVDFFWNYNGFDPNDTNIYNPKRVTAFYYLHGALHLQSSLAGETRKISGTSKSLPLGDSYNHRDTSLPLFITEGTSRYKLSKIQSNSYLNFCLEQLSNFDGNIVIIGQGLDPVFDQHLIDALLDNQNISKIAISIFSGLDKRDQRKAVRGYKERLSNSDAILYFFESHTHPLCSKEINSNKV